MDTIPLKRKIVLTKPQRKIQNKTATFGQGVLVDKTLKVNNSHHQYTQQIRKFVYKISQIITFHQQLNKVEGFNLIKNDSNRLERCQKYLKERLKKSYIKKGMRAIKNMVGNEQWGQVEIKKRIRHVEIEKDEKIYELEKRVLKLEKMIIRPSYSSRSNSVKDILMSHRKQLSYLQQISTDQSYCIQSPHHPQNNSKQHNCFRSQIMISPTNFMRSSLFIDTSNSFCSSYQSPQPKQTQSASKIRTKFIKKI